MILRLFAALALLTPAYLAAHPHSRVDQQAQVSVSRRSIVLTYRIVPSTRDGAAMFSHMDKNRDSRLSALERRGFGRELAVATRLTVNGKAVLLNVTDVSAPTRPSMSAGHGLINVRAIASVSLQRRRENRIAVIVTHHQFGGHWFLQPFYDVSVTNRINPTLVRHPRSSQITIVVPAA